MKISYDVMGENATNLRTNASKLREILDEATRYMNSISSGSGEAWDSQAASDLKNKYTELSGKFNIFYDTIVNYANFLDNVVQSYKEQDTEISKVSQDLAS